MKPWLIIVAAALQLLVLAYMTAEREWVLRTGRTIYLRTAPIDPRDAFRGDYVRLNYEIGHVSTNQLRDGLKARPADKSVKEDTRIYAALKLHGDLASVDYVSDRKPAGAELMLRGRATRQWSDNYRIRYGLEAYFVEQGKGLDLERARRAGEIQIPLEMEVAVAGNGASALKGSRWSQLGIGLNFENEVQVETNAIQNRVVTNLFPHAATVVLMNAASNDLAIVDLPEGQSLELEPDTFRDWNPVNWKWVGREHPRPRPTDADVHLLKPGEKYSMRVSLRDPRWFVRLENEKPRAITGLNAWNAQFRLFYRPPAPDECRHLKHANVIWHGEVPTRAFNGGGERID